MPKNQLPSQPAQAAETRDIDVPNDSYPNIAEGQIILGLSSRRWNELYIRAQNLVTIYYEFCPPGHSKSYGDRVENHESLVLPLEAQFSELQRCKESWGVKWVIKKAKHAVGLKMRIQKKEAILKETKEGGGSGKTAVLEIRGGTPGLPVEEGGDSDIVTKANLLREYKAGGWQQFLKAPKGPKRESMGRIPGRRRVAVDNEVGLRPLVLGRLSVRGRYTSGGQLGLNNRVPLTHPSALNNQQVFNSQFVAGSQPNLSSRPALRHQPIFSDQSSFNSQLTLVDQPISSNQPVFGGQFVLGNQPFLGRQPISGNQQVLGDQRYSSDQHVFGNQRPASRNQPVFNNQQTQRTLDNQPALGRKFTLGGHRPIFRDESPDNEPTLGRRPSFGGTPTLGRQSTLEVRPIFRSQLHSNSQPAFDSSFAIGNQLSLDDQLALNIVLDTQLAMDSKLALDRQIKIAIHRKSITMAKRLISRDPLNPPSPLVVAHKRSYEAISPLPQRKLFRVASEPLLPSIRPRLPDILPVVREGVTLGPWPTTDIMGRGACDAMLKESGLWLVSESKGSRKYMSKGSISCPDFKGGN